LVAGSWWLGVGGGEVFGGGVEVGVGSGVVAEPDRFGRQADCIVECAGADRPVFRSVSLVDDAPEQRRTATPTECIGDVWVVVGAIPPECIELLDSDVGSRGSAGGHEIATDLLATLAMALPHGAEGTANRVVH
jgi:hypothetical protein